MDIGFTKGFSLSVILFLIVINDISKNIKSPVKLYYTSTTVTFTAQDQT